MRTTIEFDPDVAAELSRRRREGGRTLRDDVNGLLRLGLAQASSRAGSSRPRFSTPTFDSGPPLVAVDDVEAALAQTEGEAHP
jgi:hypothetical protein